MAPSYDPRLVPQPTPPPRPPRPPAPAASPYPSPSQRDPANAYSHQYPTHSPPYPASPPTRPRPQPRPPLPAPPPPQPALFHHRQNPSWEESAFISSYATHSSPAPNGAATPSSSSSPPFPPLAAAHPYPAYAPATAPVQPQRQESHRQASRTSHDSSSHFSLYSLPSDHSPHSPSQGDQLRIQQQQAAAAAARDYRTRLESLHFASASEPAYAARPVASASSLSSSSASPYAPPLPRQESAPPRRQPTILMSPPTTQPTQQQRVPDYLQRNRSIDSTWSRTVTSPSLFASSSSSSGTATGTGTGTTTATSSPDVSRRPSYATYATLTPPVHASAQFAASLRSNSYDTLPYHDPPSVSPSGGPSAYLDPSLLSHLAVFLADHVPSSSSSSPGQPFSGATALTTLLRAFPPPHSADRALAQRVAQSLLAQLWIHDTAWGSALDEPLRDDDTQGFVLLVRDADLCGEIPVPTGVVTPLARCYSPFCERFEREREEEEEEGREAEREGRRGRVRGGCYAYGCPNRRPTLHRLASTLSTSGSSSAPAAAAAAVPPEAENWATSVPSSVLDGLDKRGVAYQNQVFELVQGEQKYYDDLCLIETAFVEPLKSANPPIIPPSRLAHFLSTVLLNLSSIRDHSRTFLAALRARQGETYLFHGVGQLVLAAAVEWERDYVDFTVGFPMADFLLKEEKERNPRFAELLADFSRRPEAARRGFDTFHNRATFRGLRYVLLLEQILASASPDDPDRSYLEQALQVIRRQGVEANQGIERTKELVRLREYHRDLVKKGGDMPDLELLDSASRRLFLAGKVYRRPDSGAFTDQFAEAHLVLFDHYLVLTKPPRALDRDRDRDREGAAAPPHAKYQLARRPVPVDLVQLRTTSFSDPPVPRSSGFHLRSNRSVGASNGGGSGFGGGPAGAGAGAGAGPGAPLSPVPSTTGSFATTGTGGGGGGGGSPSPGLASAGGGGGGGGGGGDSLLWPISFFQLGRYDGLVHFYVDSPAQRAQWESALHAAVSQRAAHAAQHPVVRLDPLADLTFGSTSAVVGSLSATPRADPATRFGKPTCSTPLRAGTSREWLVVAGCAEGIFVGWRAPANRQRTMQQVVHLEGITQCAVLPEFSFLLVIANKVLVAYALEALIPSKAGSKLDQASKAPQRLSGQKDVSFFKVGRIGDVDPRTLVIYAKKSGVKESVFKALEPVSQAERARGGGGGGHRFLGLGGGRPEWFRTYKEFFMPSLVTGLHFQRSKLALIGSRGVEIMDLESMRTMTVPDFPPSRHDRALYNLAKRCEDATTMGMFRIGDSKFLLAYSEFAIHVGRHGEPIEGPFIEWESKPETIAYCAPYIFAISPTIVEVRNAFSGRLAQFITGTHISLTFDGTAIPSSPPPPPPPPPLGASSASLATSDPASRRSSLAGPGDDDLAGPVERRLHLTMKQGAYHVLFEVVIVA